MIHIFFVLKLRMLSYLCILMRFLLGRLLYFCRGHDSALITNYPAFKVAQLPRFNVTCNDCGPPGSTIADRYTSHADHGNATFPTFTWIPPPGVNVAEYALVCEDPDIPVPGCSQAISIIYNIAANKNQLDDSDVRNARAPDDTSANVQLRWISDVYDSPYTGLRPLLGHGTHRYFFTVIALNAPLQLNPGRPLNKDRFAMELDGKVVGWGQWHGVFRSRE
ncbi:phosphatidylethanolamine-binding protein [Aspergillus floccosus]